VHSCSPRLAGGLLACTLSFSGAAQTPSFAVNAADFLVPAPENYTERGSKSPVLVVDADGDGRSDIVAPGGADEAYLLISFDPTTAVYRVARAPRLPLPLDVDRGASAGGPRAVGALVAGGPRKLFVATSAFGSARYDLRSGLLEKIVGGGEARPGPIGSGFVVDLDDDGENELVRVTNDGVVVEDAAQTRTYAAWALSTLSNEVVVGNFDRDPAVEIALGTGAIYELGKTNLVASGSIDARLDGEAIGLLGAGDVDRDGVDELVAVYHSQIRVYDIDESRVLWTRTASGWPGLRVQGFRLADVDGDGAVDVVTGYGMDAGAPGGFVAFAGATGRELLSFRHPDVSVNSLHVADFDGDGDLELASFLSRPVTGPFRLYVFDLRSGAVEWRSDDDRGVVVAALSTDLDRDGVQELAWVPQAPIGTGNLPIRVRDAATFAARWERRVTDGGSAGSLRRIASIAAGDLAGDGRFELAASVIGSSPEVWVVDSTTRMLARRVPFEDSTLAGAVAIGDVTGDGRNDLVVATHVFGDASRSRLHAIDGVTWAQAWVVSLAPTDGVTLQLMIRDLDGDGRNETIALTTSNSIGDVVVVDGASRQRREATGEPLVGIDAMDVVGDSRPEIVAARRDGFLEVLDGRSLAPVARNRVCESERLTAASQSRLPGAARGDVLVACRDQVLRASALDGQVVPLSGPVGWMTARGGVVLSGGETPATAWIAVTTALGLVHLRPALVAPWLLPYWRPGPEPVLPQGVAFAKHWRTPLRQTLNVGSFTGEDVRLEMVGVPSVGTASFSADTPFTFLLDTPPFKGTSMLTLRSRSASGDSTPVTFSVFVSNSAPTSASSPVAHEAIAGQERSAPVRFEDPDGDPLTVEIVRPPSRGSVRTEGAVVYYASGAGASGTDEFQVRATDGVDRTDIVTVAVTISAPTPGPAPPPAPTPSPPTTSTPNGGGGVFDAATVAILLLLAASRRRQREIRYSRAPPTSW
jgi:hypothetical protein